MPATLLNRCDWCAVIVLYERCPYVVSSISVHALKSKHYFISTHPN